jgi:hypothetical protein
MPRCAEIHYRTRTRKTRDLKPAGFPIPVTNPNVNENDNSVSDSASTLVEDTIATMELMDIPSDMTPYELLLTLPEETRMKIYTRQKTQEVLNWTPPRLTIDVERRKKSPKVCNEMLHMGYSRDDKESDSEWIQSLAVRDPNEFQDLTKYRIPSQVRCEACGECTPDIREMIVGGGDGEVYTRTIIRCNNDPMQVTIRASVRNTTRTGIL